MHCDVAIIGAGFAGLSAAIDLASRGCSVCVFEAAPTPGGKARLVRAGSSWVNGGPTVLTKRDVFEDLFDIAGESLEAHVSLHPATVLARHVWDGEPETIFDLHADPVQAESEIAQGFGGDEAERYRKFLAHIREIHDTLDQPFMRAQKPSPFELMRRVGFIRIGDLIRIAPLKTMWGALGTHFQDARLRQLFGRYATYCGSSPFSAPATLMLIAHVEQAGVWTVEGGMHGLACKMAALAERLGVSISYDSPVKRIITNRHRATGIELSNGTMIYADAVVHAGDAAALPAGILGEDVAAAAPPVPQRKRSLSAFVWSAEAVTDGFPLSHHNVFFSKDYAREFRELFQQRRVPTMPTTYICAQDRAANADQTAPTPERLQILINAPADGDTSPLSQPEIERCETTTRALLKRCGLSLRTQPEQVTLTTPEDFERCFPGSGGALYGPANHGPFATFSRPGALSKILGLYLASGSIHPGPGVPMAALSGRLVAQKVLMDFASQRRHHPVGTSGGTSMASAKMEHPASH